jgi:hypothetical protein
MRAVIYARYSSDQQREASIEDQIRLCKERIAKEGWTLAQVFRDSAMSGATTLRPGYQAMLEAAREGGFDASSPRRSIGFRAIRKMSQRCSNGCNLLASNSSHSAKAKSARSISASRER